MSEQEPEPQVIRPFHVRNELALALLLLVIHLLLGVLSARHKSLTFDEHAHLAAGLAYVQRGDARLNPEHPPLPKVLSALPLATSDAHWDDDDPTWRQAGEWLPIVQEEGLEGPRRDAARASLVTEWAFARRFLYYHNGDRLQTWLPRARLMTLLLSLLTGWIVYRWARQVWGVEAGLFALALYAFSPSVLAHARLITTDTCFTLFNTLTLYLLWRILRQPPGDRSPGLIVGLAGALAGALLSKYSALFLIGVVVLAAALFGLRQPAEVRRAWALRRAPELASAMTASLLLAWLIPFALFGEDLYLTGVQVVLSGVLQTPDHQFFLMGSTAERFPHYFLVVPLLKSTLPEIALSACWLVALVKRKLWREESGLVVFLGSFGALFFALVTLRFPNVGVRYLLPLYPLAFLAAAHLLTLSGERPRLRRTIQVLLAVHILSALIAYPSYISYMNASSLTKGKAWFLDDSNLDWGQDLPALATWCERHDVKRVKLMAFGPGDARHWGVPAERLRPGEELRRGTVVAISVYFLQRNPKLRDQVRGWTRRAIINDTIWVFEVP